MYSPKIRPKLVRQLYVLRVRKSCTMTRLVNEAIQTYVDEQLSQLNKQQPIKLEVTNEPRIKFHARALRKRGIF